MELQPRPTQFRAVFAAIHSTEGANAVKNLGWTLEEIEAVERRRCAAMIAVDEGALRALFAEDGTWTHSSGKVDTSEAFITKIASGASRYLTIERSDKAMRAYGEMAVASGIASMTALADGEPRSLHNRYTNIWVLLDGSPRLVCAQSTKLA